MAQTFSSPAFFRTDEAPLTAPAVVTRAREGRRIRPRGALGLVSAGLAGLWAVVTIGANAPAPAVPDLPQATTYTLAQRPAAPAERPAFLARAVRATPVETARPAPARAPVTLRPAVLHPSSTSPAKPLAAAVVSLSHKTQIGLVAAKPLASTAGPPKLQGVGLARLPTAADV